MVAAHIKTCEDCREMYDMMREPVNFMVTEDCQRKQKKRKNKVQESVLSKADSQRGSAVWRGYLLML
ncbi:hypothetical protein PO124_06130 [Bacillus licheniformis]|nr:hypothetical protein [Bacillus licheniformis]